MNRIKVLVTGGAGFVGSNLCKFLVDKGYDVISVDNYVSGSIENHVEGVKYIDLDIENIERVGELSGVKGLDIDVCFHLAALSRIQPSFENPTETFRVNVIGTERVLEWCRKYKVKMIYAGSSSKWHDPTISPYAMYKYLGEELCKLYRKTYGLDVDICRFYNVYGPNEILDGKWGAVIGIWRTQVLDGKPITIVGDGEQRRDFTHVYDIVSGLYKVYLYEGYHEDAWELGTGVNYSINEVYTMFKEKFDVDCVYLPDQKGNYRYTLRENDDTCNKLGWRPENSLKDYVKNL